MSTPRSADAGGNGLAALARIVGPAYFPVSALARLPLSMLTIGALTYVAAGAADFATPGVVAAVTGIGTALGAPLAGAASDRWGQRPTLLVCSAAYVLGMIWLLVAGARGAAPVTVSGALVASAFCTGLVVPQVGPMTRVRWIRRLGQAHETSAVRRLQAAQGYESTVDELSFVLGPALTGILAATLGPAVPLYVAMALAAVAVPWFAFHATSVHGRPHVEPVPSPGTQAAGPQPVPWLPIGVLMLGMLSIGTIFGSLATVTTAFAEETGHPGSGGLIYAWLGLTSGLMALSVSRWPVAWHAMRRWLMCAVVLVPVLALLWVPSHPVGMAAVLLLVGAPIGPVLVTVFSVAGNLTPTRRLGFVMTLLSAGITLGTSIGNWLAGELADDGGSRAAVVVPVGAGAALLAAGVVFWLGARGRAERR